MESRGAPKALEGPHIIVSLAMQTPIGFLGFGEAGFHLARGLRGAGAPPLVAFDIKARQGTEDERIRTRAAETGTRLVEAPLALAEAARVILSVVTASSAHDAARDLASDLTSDHLFVDLNSVSPATKQQIAAAIEAGAGRFVEGAIMAPVSAGDHRVPILLNGVWASELRGVLSPYRMRLDVMDGPTGAAAAVKMCRSIVIKGLEALLLECSLAAAEYGAADRVYESLSETYPGMDWRKMANYMIGRVLEHGERRAREMDEVAHMLRAAGIEPLMAEATARVQDWEATLRSDGRLNGPRPDTVERLLTLLVDQRRERVYEGTPEKQARTASAPTRA
jgi:3-hydroxyisobutyrate dehydrogenase-like beta-hydroxyacid dehydrogenase